MAEEIRNGCDGHCERCSANQRSYCSAQLAYYNMQEIAAIRADLARLNKDEAPFIIHGEKVEENPQENDSVDE